VLDTFMYGIEPLLHVADHPSLRIVRGDVRDARLVREELAKHEAVIHLAAIVGHPACSRDPIAARTTNAGGTENICRGIAKGQRLIHASTGSVYGKVDGLCTEETPLNPLTLYGETKASAEQTVLAAGGVCLRLATAFGVSPRFRMDLLVHDLAHMALTQRQAVLYEPGARRSFLHVRDMATAFLVALEHHDELAGGCFNVGDESLNLTKAEVARSIQAQVPFQIDESGVGADADARDYAVSYTRFRELGFRPGIGMAEGLGGILKILRALEIRTHWRNA
jgi:nucleoside-diphosphate-sugar epimerase